MCGDCGPGLCLSAQAQKNQRTLFADVTYLFHTAARPPDATVTTKGHGRLETRHIRVSSELVGYSNLPGLAQVAEVHTRVTSLATGQIREQKHYLVTSLTPAQASPLRLLELHRQHWRIENTLFHVKDDSLGEDRHVLHQRAAGTTLCHLRNTALNLLRANSRLWASSDYIPARCQYLAAQPLAAIVHGPSS